MTIRAGSAIEDILAARPALSRTFVRLGLPCYECGEPAWGTVGELCARHNRDLDEVLRALNADAASGETTGPARSSKS